MPIENWNRFYFPSTIESGPGCSRAVGKRVRRFEAERPLVVSDAGVLETGSVEPLIAQLEHAGCRPTLFTDVRSNPTDKNIYAGTIRYQENHCDSIVAVGGGSVIDTAKAIRILVSHPNPLPELYVDAGGLDHISRPMPRLVSIPTTAGTGSEVARGAYITDTNTRRKRELAHPRMTSTIVLLDPELTISLPAFLTATTGIDALSHCIEGYVAKGSNPIADGLALEAIRIIRNYLPLALEEPANLEARENMLLAASMGAMAFQKGGGVAHALAHPLSTAANLHHGQAIAAVLPTTMAFNLAAAKGRFADIGYAMGVDPARFTRDEAAEQTVATVRRFIEDLRVPTTLSSAGVEESALPDLAASAYRDPIHKTNPRSCSESDMLALYRNAL
jgi:alcohol dehydrogenase class IV